MPFICSPHTSGGVEQDGEGEKEAGIGVPDFLLELDGEMGQKKDELLGLKVI